MKRLLLAGFLSLGFAASVYAQPSVLVENFRNVNCANCREPDIQFEEWIESKKSEFHVDIIYWHNEITYSQDPFYKAAQAEVDFRDGSSFYNVSSNPRVFVQGVDAGTQLANWQNYVTLSAQQQPKATIAVSEMKSLGDNKYSFKVNATNSSGMPVRVYAAMTESGIIYDNDKLYGNPPSGKWDHIFRKMLPVREGTAPINASGEFTFTLDASGKPWNVANMQAVVFVQTVDPVQGHRLILGHTVASFGSMSVEPEFGAKGFSIRSLANPVGASAPIEVRLHTNGHLRLEMIDMTGKTIATLANNTLPEGLYQFNERLDLAQGTYLVNAFVDGVYAGNVKLVKQ